MQEAVGGSLDILRDGRELDREGDNECDQCNQAKQSVDSSVHEACGVVV
jgi:hypothetical protein